MAKAAEGLNITQSAVSQQLKKLEAELEVPLFTRLHKRLIPTPEAQKLYSILVPFIKDLQSELRTMKLSRTKPSGELRIACPHGFGKRYLPKIFTTFRRKYPDVTFKLWLGDSSRILSMLNQGEIDIAMVDVYMIQRMSTEDFMPYHLETVIDEEILLVGSSEYCAERLQGDYSLDNLVKQDFISCHLDAQAVTNWFTWHYELSAPKLRIVF